MRFGGRDAHVHSTVKAADPFASSSGCGIAGARIGCCTAPPLRAPRYALKARGALEKVKLYKARHLVEVTVARRPDLLESCFRALSNAEAVHRDKHSANPLF